MPVSVRLLLVLIAVALTLVPPYLPAESMPAGAPVLYRVKSIPVATSANVLVPLGSGDRCALAAIREDTGLFRVILPNGSTLWSGRLPQPGGGKYLSCPGDERALIHVRGDTISLSTPEGEDQVTLPGLEAVVPAGRGELAAYYSGNVVSIIRCTGGRLETAATVTVNLSKIVPIGGSPDLSLASMAATERIIVIALGDAGLLTVSVDRGITRGPFYSGRRFNSMLFVDDSHLATLSQRGDKQVIAIFYIDENGLPRRQTTSVQVDMEPLPAGLKYDPHTRTLYIAGFFFRVTEDYRLEPIAQLPWGFSMRGLLDGKAVTMGPDRSLYLIDLNNISVTPLPLEYTPLALAVCGDLVAVSYMERPYIDFYTSSGTLANRVETGLYGPPRSMLWAGQYLAVLTSGALYLYDTSGAPRGELYLPPHTSPMYMGRVGDNLLLALKEPDYNITLMVLDVPGLENVSVFRLLDVLEQLGLDASLITLPWNIQACGDTILASSYYPYSTGWSPNAKRAIMIGITPEGTLKWYFTRNISLYGLDGFGICGGSLLPVYSVERKRIGQNEHLAVVNLSIINTMSGATAASTTINLTLRTGQSPATPILATIVDQSSILFLLATKRNSTLAIIWNPQHNTTRIAQLGLPPSYGSQYSIVASGGHLVVAVKGTPNISIIGPQGTANLTLEALDSIYQVQPGPGGVWIYGVSGDSLAAILLDPNTHVILASLSLGPATPRSLPAACRGSGTAAFGTSEGVALVLPEQPGGNPGPGTPQTPSTTSPTPPGTTLVQPGETGKPLRALLLGALVLVVVGGVVLWWLRSSSCCRVTGV